jgi:ABC-type cobalamin/Fe3+-siderophores transport system ATPase subunit
MELWPDGILLGGLLAGGVYAVSEVRAFVEAAAERALADRKDARANRTARACAPYQSPYPALQTVHGALPERPALAPPIITEVPPAGPPRVPSFAELRRAGLLAPGPRFPLGVQADGALRWASWLDVYNMFVMGLSGFGKSTLLRYLASVNALNRGRLVIIDPHGDSGDESLLATLQPLSSTFLCDPATTPDAARRALRQADTIMQDRLHGRSADTTPLLVVIDELNEVMTHRAWDGAAPAVQNYLSVGNKSGRKKWCYALAAAQIGLADQLGGSEVRDSFVAQAVFRSRKKQAQLLDFDAREKAEIKGLEVGALYFQGARDTEPSKLYAFNTTPADGAALATELATGAATGGPNAANIIEVESVARAATDAATTPTVSPEQQRALDLFIEHKSMAKVVQLLDGITSSQGRTYQDAVTRRSADVAAAMAAYRGQ